MFFNLISAIPALDVRDFAFDGITDQPVAGPDVPDCVDASELALPPNPEAKPQPGYHSLTHATLASCAAGAVGISG
jgi:hypothetical protein